ncbi:putative methyltransferase-domain-containing protein, partial [Ochromonadaceae sp. CCMP2298]
MSEVAESGPRVGEKRSLINPIVNATKEDYLDEKMMPKKRFFRTRAHCNPLSYNDGFAYPTTPDDFDWAAHYPNIPLEDRVVKVLDIGMGFGGLTVALAGLLPDSLILGMEIRAKVCEYVRLRVDALRNEHTGQFQNASCLRTNCMRYLPNFFRKQQMEKIFICFPDPHFKTKNFRRRIVSHPLLSEYAFLLKPGGRLYTCTDVEELHKWHVEKCEAHPLFRRIPDEEAMESDPATRAMLESTEESKKVARLGGNKHFAVYER